jgi:hypothetical protein
MEFIIERGSHSSQEKGERETKGESCRNSEPGADVQHVRPWLFLTFVDASVLSTPTFCRREYFVDTNILWPQIFYSGCLHLYTES